MVPQYCHCYQGEFDEENEILEEFDAAASKEVIWRDGDEWYYSQGETDPNYCELKFTTESERYYSKFQFGTFQVKPLS